MVFPPPSGRQVVLTHGTQRVVVVEVGGGLRTYEAAGRPVLDGYDEDERCAAGRGQALLPWPNRLDGGWYEWDGAAYQLALTEPGSGNAIHGLTRWAAWEVLEAHTDRAVLGHTLRPQPGWGWTLELRLEYGLGDTGLDIRVRARNRSPQRAPFAAGFHPYVVAPTGRVDDLRVRLPAATRYLSDDRGLPTGTEPVDGSPYDLREPTVLGDRVLDTAFTDLTRDGQGMAVIEVGDVAVRLGPAWSHAMLFTGDTLDPSRARQGLGVEPMTAAPNALRTGEGIVVLGVGEEFEASWAITPAWI